MLLNSPDNHIHFQRDFFVVVLRPLWYTSWPCNDCGIVGFTVADPAGEGPGGLRPPLIFRPSWVPKDRKHFFGYWALPPLSRGLDDWASPLSRDLELALTYLHFWLSCYCRCRWILSVLNSSSSAHYFGLLIHLCFKCCLSWYLWAKCPWGQERGETAVFAG